MEERKLKLVGEGEGRRHKSLRKCYRVAKYDLFNFSATRRQMIPIIDCVAAAQCPDAHSRRARYTLLPIWHVKREGGREQSRHKIGASIRPSGKVLAR